MKAFIIHTPHAQSVEYANIALASFASFCGWSPQLFEGVTLQTLPHYQEEFQIPLKQPSRAMEYIHQPKGKIKQCCSLNHYRLFKLCVELDEPIAVVEHDSHCVSDWSAPLFDDVLLLNLVSSLRQPVLAPILRQNPDPFPTGIDEININGLRYRHIDPALTGKHIMPGTAAYAITPAGAQKMIDAYELVGWDQSDFMINTGYVRIQTIVPELFTFKLPNLSTSHGNNME